MRKIIDFVPSFGILIVQKRQRVLYILTELDVQIHISQLLT